MHLITLGNHDESFSGEQTRYSRPADGSEALIAERATGLGFRPFHDAHEAEMVTAAVDLATDGLDGIQETDPTSLFSICMGIQIFHCLNDLLAPGKRSRS